MITIFERMNLQDHFEGAKLADTVLRDDAFLAAMERGAKLLVDALGSGHKILSCGNGGSMCDAIRRRGVEWPLSRRYTNLCSAFLVRSLCHDLHRQRLWVRARLCPTNAGVGTSGRCALGHQHKCNSANVLAAATQAKAGHGRARLDRQRWRCTRGRGRCGGSRSLVGTPTASKRSTSGASMPGFMLWSNS